MRVESLVCGALVWLALVVARPGHRGAAGRRRAMGGAQRSTWGAGGATFGAGGATAGARRAPGGGAGRPAAADVAVLAEQIAGLVRAGLPVGRAWPALADRAGHPEVRSLAAAVVAGQLRGETAAEAMRAYLQRSAADGRLRLRRSPGSAPLRQLVVVLEVSQLTGAPLSVTLTRLAEGLRAEEAAGQERASALAGPRATAGVLSLLPPAGIALGGLLGGDPAHVLLATAAGRGCLAIGALLWLAGRAWTAVLVRHATAER